MNFPAVNEAKLQLGPRTDDYFILTVTTLARLGKLVIDGKMVEFRKVGTGPEVLSISPTRKDQRKADWRPIEDKDARRVFRTCEAGVVNVFWG